MTRGSVSPVCSEGLLWHHRGLPFMVTAWQNEVILCSFSLVIKNDDFRTFLSSLAPLSLLLCFSLIKTPPVARVGGWWGGRLTPVCAVLLLSWFHPSIVGAGRGVVDKHKAGSKGKRCREEANEVCVQVHQQRQAKPRPLWNQEAQPSPPQTAASQSHVHFFTCLKNKSSSLFKLGPPLQETPLSSVFIHQQLLSSCLQVSSAVFQNKADLFLWSPPRPPAW